jgi:hypothetical protein
MLEEDIPDISVAKYIKLFFTNKKLDNLNWGFVYFKIEERQNISLYWGMYIEDVFMT